MLNVKQAHLIAKGLIKDLSLTSILDFQEDFGFLFVKNKNEMTMGSSYILINKKTKAVTMLPTTPSNIQKIQAAKKLPLTLIL